MRKNLLIIPFLFLTFIAMAQSKVDTGNASTNTFAKSIKIYPNPAFNFIGLNQVTGVGTIIIYNLVGRKMKIFNAFKGKKYDIADLPRGMYLVQLLGSDGKIMTTQRMSKK